MNPPATAPAPLLTAELDESRQPPAQRADFIRALLEQAPVALTGNAAGLVVIVFMYQGLGDGFWLLAWAALVLLLWVLRLLHWMRYRDHRDVDNDTLLRWYRSWRVLALTQGAMWPLA